MKETTTLQIQTEEAMHALGMTLGHLLAPGDFVGLIGDLGAGKTVLAKGIAEGVGIPPAQVTSPSFAIVQTYRGRIVLHHADFYRLADEEELYATGFFDLLGGTAAVVVEWLDNIPEAAPDEKLVVHIEGSGEGTRSVVLEATGTRAAQLARDLAASTH